MVDAMLPESDSPVLLMILMMPPGAFVARVEAEPPRIDSIDDIVLSSLRKISALPKAMSPNCKIGNPSSCNCKNFAPPAATGRPRTAIFALPSPPDDSERIPGIDLKASAELLGVVTSI